MKEKSTRRKLYIIPSHGVLQNLAKWKTVKAKLKMDIPTLLLALKYGFKKSVHQKRSSVAKERSKFTVVLFVSDTQARGLSCSLMNDPSQVEALKSGRKPVDSQIRERHQLQLYFLLDVSILSPEIPFTNFLGSYNIHLLKPREEFWIWSDMLMQGLSMVPRRRKDSSYQPGSK